MAIKVQARKFHVRVANESSTRVLFKGCLVKKKTHAHVVLVWDTGHRLHGTSCTWSDKILLVNGLPEDRALGPCRSYPGQDRARGGLRPAHHIARAAKVRVNAGPWEPPWDPRRPSAQAGRHVAARRCRAVSTRRKMRGHWAQTPARHVRRLRVAVFWLLRVEWGGDGGDGEWGLADCGG